MNKPLVSIVAPFYNAEKFLHRLMDSILEQSYPAVEMIAVNNGSQDNTEEILKGYIPKFEAKGYALTCITQENSGPTGGFQTGVRQASGKYLLCPDCDDYYTKPTAFETMVATFEGLPEEYGVLRWQIQEIYDGDMLKGKLIYGNLKTHECDTIFEDCLMGKNGYAYPAIGYMLKLDYLKRLTNLRFFCRLNIGQNRIVCLPMYYAYKAYTILEPLACYLIRKSSVAHGEFRQYEMKAKLYDVAPEYIASIFKAIPSMSEAEKTKWRNLYMTQETYKMALAALRSHQLKDARCYAKDIRKYGTLTRKQKFRLFRRYIMSLLGL